MKCLEKDRTRRYETANGLAADVRRYLADEPVPAGPPSAGYRLRKFLRRNRGAGAGGEPGAPGPRRRASSGRRSAWCGPRPPGPPRPRARASGAKETAEKRLAQIEKGIDLLGSIFENLDPQAEEKEGRPLRAILGDRLDRGGRRAGRRSGRRPPRRGPAARPAGPDLPGPGPPAKAEALFAKAVATRQAELGADDPLTLDSRHNLALAYRHAGKTDEAIALFEQVRDAQERVLGADHPDTLTTLDNLAMGLPASPGGRPRPSPCWSRCGTLG